MSRLRTTDDLLAWMRDHRGQVGLVARRVRPDATADRAGTRRQDTPGRNDTAGQHGATGQGATGQHGATGQGVTRQHGTAGRGSAVDWPDAVDPTDADGGQGEGDQTDGGAAVGVAEVRHNADVRFPLASTRNVLVLGAYAEAVARRRLDPDEAVPLPDVQRWWVRGTDSGAHLDAERDWRRRDRVLRGRVLGVPLDEVVAGMVRWSSNACGDYLLDRIGVDTVHDWAVRRGMVTQDVVYPMYGELAGWISYKDGWPRLTDDERAAAMTSADPAARTVNRWRLARLGARRQALLAPAGCTGTPAEWAGLVERVHAERPGMARDEAAILRRHLGWPREVSERNSERFSVFASRGGTAAGVLTEVSYAAARDGDGTAWAVSQFYRDLPLDLWKALTRALVHQRLVLELATGARPLDDLRHALLDG